MIFGGTVLYPVRCIGAMGQLGMMIDVSSVLKHGW